MKTHYSSTDSIHPSRKLDEQANNNEDKPRKSVVFFLHSPKVAASSTSMLLYAFCFFSAFAASALKENDFFALLTRWLLVLNRKRIFKIRGRRQALIQVSLLSCCLIATLVVVCLRITVRTNVVTVRLSPIVNTVATVLLSSPLLLCF
jgi:hypothetical protein